MPESPMEFDLQPDPRILPMLGEINLAQWKCLAELINNSVDGFLEMIRSGITPEPLMVSISIPTSGTPTAKVVVRDNGPGMSQEKLERAVRAGYSGNDPISNLGLFGMGFNIATARLGTVTTVWTTRQNDPEWIGVKIDFDALREQRHFRTQALTRPKADASEHGTEVVIERLKAEQRQWLTKPANKSKLTKELSRVYSATLSLQRQSDDVPVANQQQALRRSAALHLGRRGQPGPNRPDDQVRRRERISGHQRHSSPLVLSA